MDMEVPKEKLKTYCRMIANALSGPLNVLSETGVPIEFKARQTQRVSISRRVVEKSADAEGLRRDLPAHTTQVESADDLRALRTWVAKAERQPLLVQAPFGLGKSALLAAFAVDLAKECLQILERRTGSYELHALRVPLPVRLRDVDAAEEWDNVLKLAYRQYASGAVAEQRLTRKEIRQLTHAGQLVCLYDGHDEVAAENANAMLYKIGRFHFQHKGYLISSRERPAGFNEDQIYRLEELSHESIDKLLARMLGRRKDKLQMATARFVSLKPAISSLLRRPLFLAIWARRVLECNHQAELPSTIDELMTVATLQCFERANKVLGGNCPAGNDEREGQFITLGYFLLADASTSYDEQPKLDQLREAVVKKRFAIAPAPAERERSLSPAEYDFQRTRRLAYALGLISTREGGQSWVPKTPVVEYLIGRYMASLAEGGEREQYAFVEIIRRWCYLPRTYDTLDFVCHRITALRAQVGITNGSELIDALIAWMCAVSQNEPFRAGALGKGAEIPTSDCLVRPAAWCALRMADRLKLKTVAPVAKAAIGALCEELRKEHIAIILPQVLDMRTIKVLIEEALRAMDRGDLNHYFCEDVLRMVAGRVAAVDALRLIKDLFAAAASGGIWGSAKVQYAVHGASQRLPEPDACRIFHWRERDIRSSKNVDLRSAAFDGASKRVPENVGREAIREAMAQEPNTNPVNGWIIKHAAARIESNDVLEVVRQVIDSYVLPYMWGMSAQAWAIEGAVQQVSEAEASKVVKMLIESYSKTLNSRDELAWDRAIKTAATRLSQEEAALVFDDWLSSFQNATPSYKDAWHAAVAGALLRLPQKRANKLFPVLSPVWDEAYERVPEAKVEKVVGDLIAEVPRRESWGWLGGSIKSAVGCVSEQDVPRLVAKWIKSYKTGPQKDRHYWNEAIEAAARRARDATCVIPLINLLGEQDEWRELSVEVALASDSVGFVADVVAKKQERQGDGAQWVWTGSLIPLDRQDRRLVLDPYLAVAPKLIAKLLRGEQNDSHPTAKNPLAKDFVVSAASAPAETVDLLFLRDKGRVYLNGEPLREIDSEAMSVLEKLMAEPRRVWKFDELLPRPQGDKYMHRKNYQEYVRNVVNRLPQPIRLLFEPNHGSFYGGRRFQERVKPRVE